MQIVIEIDEKRFRDIQRISTVQLKGRTPTLEQVIASGTPLPKGHGRLIDADAFISNHFGNVARLVDEAPTIIDADNKESD